METEDRNERTKYLQQEYQKILDWRNQSEDSWLKENAPKYGYHYKRENVN
jgi:LAS superfamily LD-carboxypeptidase LdcB